MYRKSYPKCKIEGSLSPSPRIQHMASIFSVPGKCFDCSFLFEGECLREEELTSGYLRLDYGFCGKEGKTDPVVIEELQEGEEIFVPFKCADCEFLLEDRLTGYVCNKDKELWGDDFRDLDWGNWQPKFPNVGIVKYGDGNLYLGQAVISNKVMRLILDGSKTKALKIYKQVNKIATIKEAKEDIEIIEIKLKKALNNS